MAHERFDRVLQVDSFRRKWASMPAEDRLLVRLAFVTFLIHPELAASRSSRLRLRAGLVEIHEIAVGDVVFVLCEVVADGRLVVIDASVLPAIDEDLEDGESLPS